MARRASIVLAFALAAAAGCQDLIHLTPGQEASGGAGGGTGTTGGAGTPTSTSLTGGAGGASTGGATTGGTAGQSGGCGPECKDGPCQSTKCDGGKCIFEYDPAGKIIDPGAPGDCIVSACDGAGNLIAKHPDDSDFPQTECGWDACADGVPGHIDRPAGTHCTGGVCNGNGQCTPATCGLANGAKNGAETGVDCGGPCPPCLKGQGCFVDADCKDGFCANGTCESRLALAVTLGNGQIVLATYRPEQQPNAWSTQVDATMYQQLFLAGVDFDQHGDGVAAVRHGNTEALTVRWSAGVWGGSAPWAISGAQESAGAWIPAMARTGSALYLFVQNANFQHKFAATSSAGVNPFVPVADASSPFAGGGAARQGHLSFVYPEGTIRLVERRFVDSKWSSAKTVLEGDYTDAQPATADLPGVGTLVVATRQNGVDHSLDWALISDKGGITHGEIGVVFSAPAAPPRRLGLAPRADGGAILAFRTPAGTLDVWLASIDQGQLGWKQSYTDNTLVGPDPAVARGAEGPAGAKAEVVWVVSGTLQHRRLLANGAWSSISTVTNSAGTTVAIAVP